MKQLILAAFTALALGLGVADAAPTTQAAPQQSGSQLDWTAGDAGWG